MNSCDWEFLYPTDFPLTISGRLGCCSENTLQLLPNVGSDDSAGGKAAGPMSPGVHFEHLKSIFMC